MYALRMGHVGIFEIKSSRFQTRKRRLNSPALSIERQHLFEVGSVGNQQDAFAAGGAMAHQMQRQAVIEGSLPQRSNTFFVKLKTKGTKMLAIRVLSLCLAITFLPEVEAQAGSMIDGLKIPESGYMQVVETKDGGMLIGRIISIDVDVVQFETRFSKTEIPIRAIKKIRKIPDSSMRNEEYYPDLNTTRLFITTTAQIMERGQGYYSNRYLFFSMLAYGVTDNFTIGAGGLTLPIPLADMPFYITPKVGLLNKESLDLALGALILRVPDPGFSTGILYGVGTFGGPEGLTAGLGWGFVNDKIENTPAIVLGGKRRWTRRLSAVAESWFFPNFYDQPMVIYGIRFLGLRMTVDVGMIAVPSEEIVFPGYPYLDFVFNFGY